MSGRIHIDRIDNKSYLSLPDEVRLTIIAAKNAARSDNPRTRGFADLRVYGNAFGGLEDGPPLPRLSQGCIYREMDVGQAHPDDPKGSRGRRRLVFEVDASGKLRETYYTEHHYAKGSFVRVR